MSREKRPRLLSTEQWALLRTLGKTISKSTLRVKRSGTKLIQIGDTLQTGPWVEVKFDWPIRHVQPLVDALATVGKASQSDLKSAKTRIATTLVAGGWSAADAAREANSVAKYAREYYGAPIPESSARNLAKNLRPKKPKP